MGSVADMMQLDPDDIPPPDREPNFNANSDVPPLRCQAEGCQNAIVKPARGRTPRFCPEHRTGNSSTKRTVWPRSAEVEKILEQYIDAIGITVSFANAEDGQIIGAGSARLAHELTELGKTDKKWRTQLDRLTAPGRYAPLTMAVMAIIMPVAMNHGLIPTFGKPNLATVTPIDEREGEEA